MIIFVLPISAVRKLPLYQATSSATFAFSIKFSPVKPLQGMYLTSLSFNKEDKSCI